MANREIGMQRFAHVFVECWCWLGVGSAFTADNLAMSYRNVVAG